MTIVYLYGGEGKYMDTGSYQWTNPPIGSTHKFILFLAQQTDEPQEDAAVAELTKFGFQELHLFPGKPIVTETLNDPRMQAFQGYYEGALTEGSSLVWYP